MLRRDHILSLSGPEHNIGSGPIRFASIIAGGVTASAFALGATMMSTSTALAGGCLSTGAGWVCSGPADSSTDVTQNNFGPSSISITTDPGFGLDVGSGAAFEIYGSGGISFIDDYDSTITGLGTGMDVQNQSSGTSGDIVIRTGSVTALDGPGVYLENAADQGTVDVEIDNVEGSQGGIQIFQHSAGAVDVTSGGTVVGGNGSGIDVLADATVDPADDSGGAITINANEVTGGYVGILVNDYSNGDVSVTATGDVTATALGNTAADGISVTKHRAAASIGDIIIDVVDVSGDLRGILARNEGSGEIQVTATGTVTGINSAGINTQSFAGSGDVFINTNNTEGVPAGIWADNDGAGKLQIVSRGTATGTGAGSAGILADNGNGNGLDIDAVNVAGVDYGLQVVATGAGTVEIDVTGTATATATGAMGDAVYVDARTGPAKAMDITVANATGGRNGIFVNTVWESRGDDDVTITVTGNIQGGAATDNWGIWANSYHAFTHINVKNGATVGSLGGNAIMNVDSDSHVVVEDGATVNGRVNLGWGDDKLDLYGGFSGITSLDGDSGTDTLQLFNSADASHAGGDILNWDIFNIDNSQLKLTGDSLSVGSVSDTITGVFLTDTSILDVGGQSFALFSNLDLAAGTTFVALGTGTGISTIAGQLNNAGTVSLTGGGAGDRLGIGSNYIGDGGTILLETVLGEDGSNTDLVEISGNTSGTSSVRVTNDGGVGAQTVGGIKIIDVAGASNGVFTLDGDYVIDGQQAVVAGAYGYTLWKNGVSPATADDGDWYLRSQLRPVDPTDPSDPTDPTGPLYQPGVPIYETYGQVLLGLNGLPTLHQRVGNRYWNDAQSPVEAYAGTGRLAIDENGVWGVIEGSNAHYRPDNSTSGSEYDLNIGRLRTGVDGLVSETENGKIIAGLNALYGQASSDITSVFGSGSISTDAYGFGATATWYDNNGFYLDGQAQLTWFDSDLSSNLVGELTSGNDGFGYALSLEAGQRFGVANNWAIIPQAQLVYSHVRFDTFVDPFGATVGADGLDSFRGRLGLAIEHQDSWTNEQGQVERGAVYGIANLHYEFLDGASVGVSGTKISSENDPLWGELGLGGSYNWNDDKYSLYGEISASSSLENLGDNYALNGRAGLRIRW